MTRSGRGCVKTIVLTQPLPTPDENPPPVVRWNVAKAALDKKLAESRPFPDFRADRKMSARLSPRRTTDR